MTARVRLLASKPPEPKEVPAPAPPPRRPAFYEALAVYETGVRALQRHDFQAAANSLRSVIQGYPGERELVERARLYLQVCERETARRPAGIWRERSLYRLTEQATRRPTTGRNRGRVSFAARVRRLECR